jgi:hypothetical protein
VEPAHPNNLKTKEQASLCQHSAFSYPEPGSLFLSFFFPLCWGLALWSHTCQTTALPLSYTPMPSFFVLLLKCIFVSNLLPSFSVSAHAKGKFFLQGSPLNITSLKHMIHFKYILEKLRTDTSSLIILRLV